MCLNPLIIREELLRIQEIGYNVYWSLNPLIIREELLQVKEWRAKNK